MSFLEDYKKLLLETPKLALTQWNCENSAFTSHTNHSKDCFFTRGSGWQRDCYYNYWVYHGEDVVDCSYCEKCELCYECMDCARCYGCSFCQDCKDCRDCVGCYDCTGCDECYGCVGLVRKKYHLFNEKVSQEEYESYIENVRFSEHDVKQVQELKLKVPHRDFILKSEDCVGNHIENSQRCYWSFDMVRSRDDAYCFNAYEIIDSVDCSFTKVELGYECIGGGWNFNCNYSCFLANCSDCQFCFQCQDCKSCFMCDGLHHKKYHVLNEPCTSKEEYETRVAEIWKELLESSEAGNLMSVFEDEEFEGIEH
ncbi:hypothetical protein HOG17_01400 [Candidatus Peregrinibacteria bacterium]|jgi:hypothetical protein|nr:hypothetical protein [Candidatus Peregrinibacteria bacterium]MBT4148388.1 hypothetical protein [Candidatus Peregrinibacteria bacterium]MBT4365874.1 hypothetical protein [Candidatus Peregrinibacteria bacterium]MBT4456505.1 hypothetical protein [Candidatus Peregrinibacteria bacterium]